MFAEIAHAMGTSGAGNSGEQVSPLVSIAPFLLIFVIFYLLLIRPQQKERRRTQAMLDNLKAGDQVITSGGILGTIHSVSDKTVQLKINDKVRISILRSAIRGLQDSETEPPPGEH